MGRDPFEEEHLALFGNDGASSVFDSGFSTATRSRVHFLTAPPKDLSVRRCAIVQCFLKGT